MQRGIITLLDILGWKGIWQRQDDALTKLQQLLEVAAIYVPNNQIVSPLAVTDPAEQKRLKPTFEVINISDTIAIVSYPFLLAEEKEHPYQPIISPLQHCKAAQAIICNSIALGIPVRGAIGIGEFSRQGNTLVGPAVDEAASWYEQADWMGIHLCPSLQFMPELERALYGIRADDMPLASSLKGTLDEYRLGELMPYQVPLKGRAQKGYAVNWPKYWVESMHFDFPLLTHPAVIPAVEREQPYSREDLLRYFLKQGPITPEIYSKFTNTLAFFDECMAKMGPFYANAYRPN